ncbi:hypothetical protein FGIG_03452 [Fasciola gigantica]|uniref:RUN domain-containing protein n=1 Tax=Fasciola gigantica TaxID=46835 RepID=A0A504YE16_FASGI|nr:hypothetical protein FGIG_03452 [Fasciola gigantica]
MDIERINLLSIARYLIREVVRKMDAKQQIVLGKENSESNQVESDFREEPTIQALLTVIEHCLCHGLRTDLPTQDITYQNMTETTSPLEVIRNSASALRRAKDQVIQTANSLLAVSRALPNPWPVVLHMEQCHPVADKLSAHVLSLSEVRTGLGKSRVWIRYALMYKELGAYLQHMLDSDFKLTDSKCSSSSDSPSSPNVSILTRHSFYHPGALLLNNEGVVFVGLLVGLAAVDFCFILKDKLDEFDSGLDTIPYHICIEAHKESKTEYGDNREIAVSTDERTSFLKQNKYLENENRKLLRRLQDASAAHTRLSESVNNLSKELGSIKLENQGFKIMLAHLKKNNSLTVNGPPKSVNGKSNSSILGQPLDLENELKQALNQVDEKTVLVDSLRGEINELQSRSVQLMRQLSSREKSLDEKQLLIRQLEGKSKGMSNIMEQMRERVSSLTNEKTSSERVIGQLRMQLKELQARVTKQDGVIQSQKDICNQLESRLSDQSDELTRLRATETKINTYQTRQTTFVPIRMLKFVPKAMPKLGCSRGIATSSAATKSYM